MKKLSIFVIAGVLSWEALRLLNKLKVRLLTDRQREILNLIVEGYTDDEIAIGLHLRQETVKEYVHNILKRLNVQDISSAIKYAIETGLEFLRNVPVPNTLLLVGFGLVGVAGIRRRLKR